MSASVEHVGSTETHHKDHKEHKRSGLKSKLFGGVKVKRARSFSGREKHKVDSSKQLKDDTATLSDTEGYHKNRRPRRRTTGGKDVDDAVQKAKMTGFSSDHEDQHGGTLNRQQIIAMVKQRFGLRPEDGRTVTKTTTITEEEIPPVVPPLPPSPSSPKQRRYEELLEQPGTYPTLPRKEDAPQPVNTPGVVYLQIGDEIKRAMIPQDLGDVKQVRSLFEDAFTEKYKNEVNNNSKRKTIYIKDPTCGIFYELDDVTDLSNKSHLKILDSAPKRAENGPMSPKPQFVPMATHVTKPVTSTPLPNHSHVVPSDPLEGGQYKWTTTVTETRVTDNKPQSVTRTAVSQGSLMDKKKVPLPGLGSKLHPHEKKTRQADPMEQQLDQLTNMLQDALNTTESLDSLPVRSQESSATSSQTSFVDHGPAPEVKPKPIPTPPPRGVSRETSFKYNQTLQREPPQPPQRNLVQHYGTLPLTTSTARHTAQRSISTDSPGASLSGVSTLPAGASVKYQGMMEPQVDKKKLRSKALDLKNDVVTLKSQLGQLKQFHTYQAKSFEELMANAKEQLVTCMKKLSSASEDSPSKGDRPRIRGEEMKYVRAKNDINRSISELESEVEMVRLDVIQRRYIGNRNEIDGLNNQLAIISRQIADVKSQYAELHDDMKGIMADELNVIVQGDKFLKDEPSKLDNLVSRCKHVTGTLFTLQKLVAAQEQMKSESQLSFSSLDDVDKELLDSIRSSYLTKPTPPPTTAVQEVPQWTFIRTGRKN